MTKLKKFERISFITISIVSILCGLLCIIMSGADFGILFFFTLALCTMGMVILLHIQATKKQNSRLLSIVIWTGRVLFYLWILTFVIVESMIAYHARTDDMPNPPQYYIVLGAGLYGDQPSQVLVERLEVTYEHMIQNPDTKAVLCGGMGEGETITEAVAMQRWLIEAGIHPDRLLLEDASTNTLENIAHAKVILDELQDGVSYETAVISSEFHLFRAQRLTQQAGLDSYKIAAETPYVSLRTLYAIREYFSIMGLVFTGRF